MSIDTSTLWRRLKDLEGEVFHTKTGKEFTYEITGKTLLTSRTDFPLGAADFAKALSLVPIDGPGEISDLVRGSAYIWALLHDPRVRKSDW